MLTHGEWQALDWYFKLYSKISVMNIRFDITDKQARIFPKKLNVFLVILVWAHFQCIVPIYFASIAVLSTQEKKVPLHQIMFYLFYLFVFFTAFVPSCILAITPHMIELMVNEITLIKFITKGKYIV